MIVVSNGLAELGVTGRNAPYEHCFVSIRSGLGSSPLFGLGCSVPIMRGENAQGQSLTEKDIVLVWFMVLTHIVSNAPTNGAHLGNIC